MFYLAEHSGVTNYWGDYKSNRITTNQIKCWFLVRGENWTTRGKTSQSRVENQQTPQILEFLFCLPLKFSHCVKLHLICNMLLKKDSFKRRHEPTIIIIVNNIGSLLLFTAMHSLSLWGRRIKSCWYPEFFRLP